MGDETPAEFSLDRLTRLGVSAPYLQFLPRPRVVGTIYRQLWYPARLIPTGL
jgi:hypothetical protein